MHISNRDVLLDRPEPARTARRDALDMLEAALDSVDPYQATRNALSLEDGNLSAGEVTIDLASIADVYVIGFGKASVGMARAVETLLPVTDGLIISTGEADLEYIGVRQGDHPLPSQRNVEATRELLDLLDQAGPDDLVIGLISGGGSALLCQPSISLEAMREVTRRLMQAGCTIQELNTVRKHLSAVKGGQLAARCQARILSLVISDVIGDPLAFIASGPMAPDPTTYTDARDVLKKYELWRDGEVMRHIESGCHGDQMETPARLENVDHVIVANNERACRHACTAAQRKGYHCDVASTTLSGEARQVGRDVARYVKLLPREHAAVVFGGETTVTVNGNGSGGRNQELVLGALEEIVGERLVLLSCGTDGVDGSSPAGGAIADGDTLQRAHQENLDPAAALRENDSYGFFDALGDAIMTGPTGTNVMDIQIIIKY
ncbi:MAG: glycerate kinase type-2 family protein [Thermoplasmatota archaeon]